MTDEHVLAGPALGAHDGAESAERRYRELFDCMSEGFAVHEILCDEGGHPVDYRFLEVNPAFERLTGLSRGRVIGRTMREILPGDDPRWVEEYGRVALTGEPLRFENRSIELGRWYEVFAYRPRRMQFAVIFTDITERKDAEQALRASEERAAWLASFPSRNPLPVMEIDSEGGVRYANPPAQPIVSAIRAVGNRHPWLAGWDEVVRAFREGGATSSQERTVVVGESAFQQMMYYVPETGCIRIYAIDVTRRRGAEAELRESEQRLRALADSMPQLAWTARPDGYITWYNRRWYDYTGTTPEQMAGWGWQAVHDPATLPDVMRRWMDSIATGRPFEMEFPLRGADGRFRRFLTRVFPLKDEAGCVLQWFGTNTDVTELVEAREALREADRRKDEFLSMLSHELRNPLAPIRNSIYILRHADASTEQGRRAQRVIERQTDHLTRLVDDLLDVTRIARGKVQLRRERVDLREVVVRAEEDLRLTLSDRGVVFRSAFPDAEVWVDADPTRVSQVVGNLLHNAAKFTRRGDEVTLSLRVADADAEIVVRDTGAGIDPALLPQVFEPFVQGERTLARTEGGLGLGLALVKGITELHGGRVRAESAGKGKGATFTISLPLLAAPPAPAEPRSVAARSPRGRRVLVVDDNADAAETLAEIVRLLGHEVEVAFDGQGALDKIRANPPDVLLCDLGLPGMDGYEIARAIRAGGGAGMQLIAVSGYAQPDDVKRAVEAGFDGHVAKPPDIHEIERLLT